MPNEKNFDRNFLFFYGRMCFTGNFRLDTKISAHDLMDDINASSADPRSIDGKFILSYVDFSLELFNKSHRDGENTMISPLSVMLALAMTANGAAGETKTEMEAVLGEAIPLEELNEYLYSFVQKLSSVDEGRLDIANSVWYRDNENIFQLDQDFLEKNKAYYDPSIFKASFDNQTVNDINNWVKQNTGGKIDKIIEEIDPQTIMYLINAVYFESEWAQKFEKKSMSNGIFTLSDGTERSVTMMSSTESMYINDGKVRGFIKKYKNEAYGFAALRPENGVTADEYIASMTGKSFMAVINSAFNYKVEVLLPKFSFDYSIDLKKSLVDMGMPLAFTADLADFSGMGTVPDNIYISCVLHKSFIEVDENGTKVAAATSVGTLFTGIPNPINFDRPFVFAIIDVETCLPLFIGVANDIGR